MSFLDDIKLPIREVIALVIFCVGVSGTWYKFATQMEVLLAEIESIPSQIRLGDIKVEMQTLNMELSYMEGSPRDEKAERLYKSKSRTLARLEVEWADLQKQ